MVAAARRNGVGDAIFVHSVAVLAQSARTPQTLHYFRAIAMDGECWGGSELRESFVMRRDDASSCPTTSVVASPASASQHQRQRHREHELHHERIPFRDPVEPPCWSPHVSRCMVFGRGKMTSERASHRSGGDATSAATLRRAEPRRRGRIESAPRRKRGGRASEENSAGTGGEGQRSHVLL